ncbi:MAG: hypothetical protein M5U28_19320 [Sandaracinaceae bacterium]|nr:hypothetical protein [Sandaracinaceae bacterium]
MGALEQVPMLPARTLEALWAWNYARAERQRRWPGVFVPRIVAICRRQTTETACVWTGFVRSILPEVDTVLVMALAAPDAKPVRWSDLAQHLVEGADDGRRWAGPTPQRVPDAVHDLVSRTTTDRTIRMLRFDELLEARSR